MIISIQRRDGALQLVLQFCYVATSAIVPAVTMEGCNPCYAWYYRTDLLVGYRHYLLGDNLSIGEDIFDTRVNSRFQITDNFSTRNEFNGAEIGLNTEMRRGRWTVGLLAKMAMGNTHQTVTIDGTTIITTGAQTRVLRRWNLRRGYELGQT